MKINPDEWYDIRGKSGLRNLWAHAEGPGQPEYGPWTLPDGTDVDDEIAYGRIEKLPFPVTFVRGKPSRGERRGDVLWAGGLAYTLVSDRFIKVLVELEVPGLTTYPVDFYDRDRAKTPIHGYVGLVPDLTWAGPVRSSFKDGLGFSLLIRGDVLQGLLDRGVDQFDYKIYEEPGEPEF